METLAPLELFPTLSPDVCIWINEIVPSVFNIDEIT